MANAQFPNTSLHARAASPDELLRLNSGHRAVENLNNRPRDCVFGEDACVARTGNGPANRASLNNIALTVIFTNHLEAESLPKDQPQRGKVLMPGNRCECLQTGLKGRILDPCYERGGGI